LRQRDKDKVRNKVLFLDSAKELFTEKGYYNTTMEEIADRAGFSKATIYNYFDGKKHLLTELISTVFAEIQSLIDEMFAKENDFRKGVEAYVEISIDYIENNRKFYLVMMSESFRQKSMVDEVIHKKVFAGIEVLRKRVTDFCNKHENEINPNIPPKEIAHMLMALVTGYVGDWMFSRGRGDLRNKKKIVIEQFFNGALAKT
jgi:AcrR family transcriptional regulator